MIAGGWLGNVRLETRKVAITHFKIRVGKAPVICSGVRVGGIIADGGEVLENFVPDPVARDEKVGGIEALRSA